MTDLSIHNAPSAPMRAAPAVERRIDALDGLRGLMTVFVLFSHFFAEIDGGWMRLAVGWVAVDVFFALSGFLVGRLILDKGDRQNFLGVFFLRRICRTFPIYFVCVIGAYLLIAPQSSAWNGMSDALPFWSYLTFTQNLLMASHSTVGVDWLSPTWTMAVEEQFYLIAPALIIFTPRRYLPALLLASALGAVGFRLWVVVADWPFLHARVTLMGRADLFALGILAALAFRHGWCASAPRAMAVRVAVPVCMLVFAGLMVVAGNGSTLFRSAGPFVIAVAAALFILSLAQGAPEGQRLEGGVLRFFGHNSFAIYLSHMPLLWLMHGLLLGARPSIASIEGFAVTLATLPLCLIVSRLLTIAVEEPCTRFGRSFRWSEERR